MTDALSRMAAALADRYRIERELGQGGMATVYLAHDVRHDRHVALKVLRPELAAILGGERFLKEIRTTANLQHPHILTLHDSGEADGLVYYVMPYVEGESLRDRLNREKQLPVDEALRITKEVAGALDYAHRHGVVHRDIKPENILLHDGSATVADFGIALAASRSEGSTRMTETGMSLGTPQYMAPEQAMGERDITPKVDVYALGCVLYEMLTGEPPYTGPTAQAIIARVMTEQPRSLTMQRHTIPPAIDAAVHRALEKLPADRFASAKEFAEALDGRGMSPGTSGYAAANLAPARSSGRWGPVLAAGVAIGALAAVAILAFRRPADRPALRLSVLLPSEAAPIAIRLSPDASIIAFAGAGRGDRSAIYTRRVDDPMARRMDGTEDAIALSFSPDGKWIAYATPGLVARRVAVLGGAPSPIAVRGGGGVTKIEYAGDDRFIINTGIGSLATLDGDGNVRIFAAVDSVTPFISLDQVLPDGSVLARPWTVPPNGPLAVYDPRTGARTVILDALTSWASYSEGTLAWALVDGTMYAAPYSVRGRRLTGPAVPLGASVLAVLGFPPPASFEHGTLVYSPTRARALVRVDRSGLARVIEGTDRTWHSPRVSPDGRRLLVDFTDQVRDVWVIDLADSTMTRFGFDSTAHDAMWLPDGSGAVFAGIRSGNAVPFRRRFAGGPAAEVLASSGGSSQLTVHAITPDGRFGVAARINAGGDFDLVRVRLDGSGTVDTLLATGYNEGYPALSPDGRWLAYASDESGRQEVYVRAFPGMTAKVQVSQDGGSEPAWSRRGDELFYRSGGTTEPRLIAATVETGSTFRVARRQPLFGIASYEVATPHTNYDVFPDGQSFAMVRQGRPGQAAEIVYAQGIPELVRRRAN